MASCELEATKQDKEPTILLGASEFILLRDR
jgi:hypothetical protein